MRILKIALISLFLFMLLINGCKKTPKKKEEVTVKEVKSSRKRERQSNEWCIEWGIIQDTMTLEQCERSMGEPLEFRVDLKEGWAIYGLDYWNVYVRYGVVKSRGDWVMYYIMKSIEYGREKGILK